MIDSEATAITRRLLDAEVRLREKALEDQTRSIKERMSARGMLNSSVTVEQISNLARQEFRARIHLAWDMLQRVLSDTGVQLSADLTQELFECTDAYLEETFQKLATFLTHATQNLGMGAGVGPLQDEAQALKHEFKAKADLLALTLRRRSESPEKSTVMNFYGTVGAIQTGALSTATVGQHVGQADMTALKTALERIADEIGAASDLAADHRRELTEVLGDLKLEISKSQPNTIRLRQLAMGTAIGIQTTASLQPAYRLLKVALLPFGVALP